MTNTIKTVRELLSHYVSNHEYGLKQNTIACWLKPGVSKLEQFLERPAMITDLNLPTVNAYVDWLKATASSSQMARSRRGPILLLVLYGNDLGLVPKFVGRIRKLRIVRKTPVGWTSAEVQTLLRLCLDETIIVKKCAKEGAIHHNSKNANTLRCGTRVGLFLAGLVAVAWDSTLRLGDVLELKWSDLTIDEDGRARAQVTMSKTGFIQPVTLSSETVRILREVQRSRKEPTEKLLDWPYRKEKLFDWVRSFVRESGIRPGTLRYIRRGSASAAEHIERGGGKAALGHRSDWVAQAHYLDPTIVGQKDIAKPSLYGSKLTVPPTPTTASDSAPSGLTGVEALLVKLFRQADPSKREEILGGLV